MSMPTTVIDAPANKVIRRYVIEPGTVNGHSLGDAVEIGLRYNELEALALHRDSVEALAEAVAFARKRGMISAKAVNAKAACIRETLRRAS